MKAETLKGHLDALVLAALRGRPAHGYAVIEELKRRSEGAFDLAEGTVYPVLHRLEKDGHLSARRETAQGRSRVVYRLTAAGRKRLAASTAAWRRVVAGVNQVLLGEKHGSPAVT